MKKLLFITTEYPPGPGGIGNHAWNLSRKLNNYFDVDLLTVSNYIEQSDCDIFDQKQNHYIYRFKRYFLSFITYFFRIYDIIYHLKSVYDHDVYV